MTYSYRLIMIFPILMSLFVFTYATELERKFYHPDHAQAYFKEFITTYGKTYSRIEILERFEIFKENLMLINRLNSFNESIHGITEFTDMSEEEFSEQYNSCIGPETSEWMQRSRCKVIYDSDVITHKAPKSLDYRNINAVSPVKNQGHCNSCWAFASVGSLEGVYALKYRRLENFSPQQLMDCLQCSGHCRRGGYMHLAFSELISKAGVMLESDYPYVERDMSCRAVDGKARVRVTGCYNYDLKDEDKLMEALALYGPIAMGINSAPFANYIGGIITVNGCPPAPPGHAVLLIGYGTENGVDYWLFKNSYGPAWGPYGGYFKLARGQNVCGMMNKLAASPVIA